jgi:hypothetical protein
MIKALHRSGKDPSVNDPLEAEESIRARGNGMSPAETARYVAEFSAELSYLARQAKLDLLAYLLDMARLEAIRTAQMDEKNS